ncbi:MAG: hypothetical protein QME32_06395 [Endomicrobiia bacterium]|nr:hypothetical protein [Endomicrobiia bacterium]
MSATRVAAAALFAVLLSAATARATLEIYAESNQVDGVYNNPRVIARVEALARKPIFSWGMAGSEIVTSFVVGVATSPLDGGTTIFLWSVADSTSPANMTRLARYDLIKISYAGESLETATTYYWGVQAYGDRGSTATALGYFHTIAAAQTPSAPTMDIRIDYNNPLKPGRVAHLVAAAFDRDRTVKLRVFSMTGELVMDWPEFIVPKNAYYVVEWNGNDINGSRLKRGIYIVNLYDENDKTRVNRRMAILDR